jgi:hypothetical protein
MTKKDGYYMTLSEPEQSILMQEALTKLYANVILRDTIKASSGTNRFKNTYRNIDIVIGRAVHGMTFKELADDYEVSVQTIKITYYRNLAYFARVLKKEDLMNIGYN